MDAVFRTVQTAGIRLDDRTFEIDSFAAHERLEASMDRHGILSPVTLLERDGGGYAVLDGFKRVRRAFKSGTDRLPALVYGPDADLSRLMLRRIEGKLFGPPLDPAEKACIVSKLVSLSLPPKESAFLFSAMGIPARAEVVERWRRLALSGETILGSVARGEISERTALSLADWGEDAGEELCGLIVELRCSASIQAELVERVDELALRMNTTRSGVLGDPAIRAIRDASEKNHREKTQELREALYRLRFPRLGAREERFARELSAMGVPASVQIIPPRGFEGNGWKLQVAFSSPEELRDAVSKLEKTVGSSGLERLMSPGGGDS